MPATISLRGGDPATMRLDPGSAPTKPATPSLTDGETTTNGYTTDDEFEDMNAFETQLRLRMAQRRIIELKKESVEFYKQKTEAEARSWALEQALGSADHDEVNVLRQKLMQVENERDAALLSRSEAKKETEQTKLEAEKIRGVLQRSRNVGNALAADLEEADQETLDHLQILLSKRDAKIKQLVEKNEQLIEEDKVQSTRIKTLKDEKVFLKARNDYLEFEMKDRRKDLDLARDETAKARSDHNRLVFERNNAIGSQVTNLANDKTRLQSRINELESKINKLRSNTAYHVTQMDLAFDKWRVFTCTHSHLANIPDGNNSTRDTFCTDDVVDDILDDWKNDTKFIKEYNAHRREILEHHRAHERMSQGKGTKSFRIRKEFVARDTERGIAIKY